MNVNPHIGGFCLRTQPFRSVGMGKSRRFPSLRIAEEELHTLRTKRLALPNWVILANVSTDEGSRIGVIRRHSRRVRTPGRACRT